MAKRKQKLIIPFTEEGMREFKSLKSATDYFGSNLNIDAREVAALFQNTFMISVNKFSINVLKLQELSEAGFRSRIKEIFPNFSADELERVGDSFVEERKKWLSKFKG